MAFTITYHGGGYKLSVADGRPSHARNVDEICEAIRHYYAKPYHSEPKPGCPFCRKMDVPPTGRTEEAS